MLTIEEYLNDPCGSLSIPYWKAKSISIPENMKIVPDQQFDENDRERFFDERYFRLRHGLKNISAPDLMGYELKTAKESDFGIIAEIINRSYAEIKIDEKRLKELTETPVYAPELWILVIEKSTERAVACGIADIDQEAREGVLEWIQVLPEYRQKGIGKLLVNELLRRMEGKADFATVSGKIDGESRAERLYRACGFEGNAIWHVMRRKTL